MKKAFTLVELLVVIAILGILMGVLLSTFSGAGESARAAKCMTNLHNLAVAVQNCSMEGSMPKAEQTADKKGKVTRGWISWSTEGAGGSYISPYAGSLEEREFSLTNGTLWAAINRDRNSYFCPTHQKYAREHNLGLDPLWSYVMNSGISGSITSLSRADKILLFAELPFAKITNGGFSQSGQLSNDGLDPVLKAKKANGSGGGDESIGFNHKNGKTLYAHICYADGHVAKLVAPKAGDAKNLTSWLCYPNDGDSDIDITFDGTHYQKISATE